MYATFFIYDWSLIFATCYSEHENGITAIVNEKLDDFNSDDMWLQQNVSTRRTSRGIISLLREKFNDNATPKNVYISLPQRSCDATLFHVLLWGYVGALANKPRTFNDSIVRSIQFISDISKDIIFQINMVRTNIYGERNDLDLWRPHIIYWIKLNFTFLPSVLWCHWLNG